MNRIQNLIQIDLLAGASCQVEPDEQIEFLDYCLRAHCGFDEFYSPDETIPLVVPRDEVLNDDHQ